MSTVGISLETRLAPYREFLHARRELPSHTTFLERVVLFDRAERAVENPRRIRQGSSLHPRRIPQDSSPLSQPLRFGETIRLVLEDLSLPITNTDLLLGNVLMVVPDDEEEAFFQDRVASWGGSLLPWMQDLTHDTPDWERLVRLGLPGLEEHAGQCLQERRAAGAPVAEVEFLRGAVLVYQAFRSYARRWAVAGRAAGLENPAGWCERIADHAPRTFAEALQLVWLVGYTLVMIAGGVGALCYGRVDQYLWPFYWRDIDAGRLSRDEATALVDNFFVKIYSHYGVGEHQLSGDDGREQTGWVRNPSYDGSTYLMVGGRRRDGAPVANELTEIVLDGLRLGLKTPTVILRHTCDLPARIWEQVTARVMDNSALFVYNDKTMIPALESCGVEPQDAREYSFYGCNDPHITGKEGSLVQRWANLARITHELAVQREPFADTSELVATFRQRFRGLLGEYGEELDAAAASADPHLLRMLDCFLDGPVDRACDWGTDGVDYHHCLIQLCGLATAVDSLAALTALVADERSCSLEEIAAALEADFDGHEAVRARLLAVPKFGGDDDRSNAIAADLVHGLCDDIEAANQASDRRYRMIPCISTDMQHVSMGSQTGATADGRNAGEPISENQSPGPGRARSGLTAMLNSVLSIPFERIAGGPLNVMVQPSQFTGREEVLGSLLQTYLSRGGMQLQVSAVERETLLAAQARPEDFRDLQVRVTGYSAYFVDMSPAAQEEIIRRVG